MTKKGTPAFRIFLGPFTNSENMAVTVGAYSDGNKHGNVLDLPAPASLEPNPIEVDVNVLAFNRSRPPSLNSLIDLLVQFAHGT